MTPTKEFWVLAGGILAFFLVAFLGQATYTENTARKEITNALYRVVWEDAWAKAHQEPPSPYYQFRAIPAPARPGFLNFVVEDVKKNMFLPERQIKDFLETVPKKGVGIALGLALLGQPDDKSQAVAFGVRIAQVFDNTPATRAGLCEGDRILAIDGEAMNVSSPPDQVFMQTGALLERANAKLQQNDQTIVLEVARGAKGQKFTVRVSEHNAYEHLQDYNKVLQQWSTASAAFREKRAEALKAVGALAAYPGEQIHFSASPLDMLLLHERGLDDLRMKFIDGLQPLAPDCKNK